MVIIIKKIINIIVLILSISSFVSCKQSESKDESAISVSNKVNNITATPLSENTEDVTDFDSNIYEQTIKGIFGGNKIEDIQKKLGKPIKKIEKTDYERWYFKHGIEIDVVNQNDAFYELFNYIYISPMSDMRTPENIGIGSLKDEIIKAYGRNVNYKETNNENIIIGYDDIKFVMNNDKVESIFISTGAFTEDEGKN